MPQVLFELKDWLVGSPDATVVFFISLFGLFQYYRNQAWKRKEFAFQTIHGLQEIPAVRDMVRLIAWDHGSGGSFGEQVVTRQSAIEVLEEGPGELSDAQRLVAYAVDEFLTNLDMLLFYVRRGLMSWDDTKQHLDYLVNLFAWSSEEKTFTLAERRRYVSWPIRLFRSLRVHRRKGGSGSQTNALADALVGYCKTWNYDNILWAIANYAQPSPRAAAGRPAAPPPPSEAKGSSGNETSMRVNPNDSERVG
jgi:hypothetical protein